MAKKFYSIGKLTDIVEAKVDKAEVNYSGGVDSFLGKIPKVSGTGVLDIGKAINMRQSGSTTIYDVRLEVTTGNILKLFGGPLDTQTGYVNTNNMYKLNNSNLVRGGANTDLIFNSLSGYYQGNIFFETNDSRKLYHRTDSGTYDIYTAKNPPSLEKLGALSLGGGTLTGDLHISRTADANLEVNCTAQKTATLWLGEGPVGMQVSYKGAIDKGSVSMVNTDGGDPIEAFNITRSSGRVYFPLSPYIDETQPTAANSLTRKDYVDTKLPLTGGTLTGILSIKRNATYTASFSQSVGSGHAEIGVNNKWHYFKVDGSTQHPGEIYANATKRVYHEGFPPTALDVAMETTTAVTQDENGDSIEHTVVTKTLMDTINELQAKIALLEVKVKTLEGI